MCGRGNTLGAAPATCSSFDGGRHRRVRILFGGVPAGGLGRWRVGVGAFIGVGAVAPGAPAVGVVRADGRLGLARRLFLGRASGRRLDDRRGGVGGRGLGGLGLGLFGRRLRDDGRLRRGASAGRGRAGRRRLRRSRRRGGRRRGHRWDERRRGRGLGGRRRLDLVRRRVGGRRCRRRRRAVGIVAGAGPEDRDADDRQDRGPPERDPREELLPGGIDDGDGGERRAPVLA